MKLFGMFNKNKTDEWKDAYKGNPNFYRKADGSPFGAFALTENTLTSLPKDPKELYKVNNKAVEEWKLMLVSTTHNSILGDTDYYNAIKKLAKFTTADDGKNILIRGLSLEELKEILK